MLSLNLLSIRQKKEAKARRFNLLLRQITTALLLVGILISLMMYGAQDMLRKNFKKLTFKDVRVTDFDSEIRKSNDLAMFLGEVQAQHVTWSDFLIELSLKTPQSVQLTTAQIDKKGNKITVNGWAPLRDDLLEFKNNLESSLMFNNINLPIQSLAQKEDINFVIDAELNKL